MIVYTEKGAGLHEAIRAAGHYLEQRWPGGAWVSSNDAAVQAIIDAYDALPWTKAQRLQAIRAEAGARIEAKYPWWVQTNAANGIYSQAQADAMRADIAAVIQASNAAEDAVEAATSVAQVEAVAVTWPAI